MKHLKLLNNLFLFLLLTLVSANSFAETKWEVATVFFGINEDEEFQQDIQKNLEEISRIKPSAYLSVSTYKEVPNNSKAQLLTFLKKAFKNPNSKKALVFYGHGEGPLGLRNQPTAELKSLLSDLKIKLDIIWFDACFLSNIEFLYELRNFSTFTIASEEAEFSAGLPFESLSELPAYAHADEAAEFLAKNFIESYSYLKEGTQREAVATSSATISVVDNAELKSFMTLFKKASTLIKKLPKIEQANLKNRLAKKFSMDKKELVDLGHLLIELRLIIKDPALDKELTKLIRLLNIESVKKLKTNPRLRIRPPTANAQMVFGFNNWENGAKDEYLDNPLFKDIIATKTFLPGPNKTQWPVRKFENASMIVSPFAPGINSFDYYFLDLNGKLLTEPVSITREFDIVETSLSINDPGSFLLYSGYTQQVGSKAEKYTGVNISLFNTVPSMDYFELEFNKEIDWLSF